ncbi:MAG: hypothetical protein ABTD50_02370 [Polyangiaceae bacterium]|jgi:hypothetical protein
MNARVTVPLVAAMVMALVTGLGATQARASKGSKDGRQEGSEARVHVEPSGVAIVDYELRYRVVHGPLHSVDLFGIDDAVEVDSRVVVSGDDGREATARAESVPAGGVRIAIEDPRGLPRGVFTMDVRWRADLLRTGALSRRGGGWVLTWSSPRPLDGFDGARTAFQIPGAPDAPQPVVPSTGATDEDSGAVIRRTGQYDEIEIVTPHVSPGQAQITTLRLDERALDLATRAPSPSPAHPQGLEPDPPRRAACWALLVLLALSLAAVLAKTTGALSAACASRGIPLPRGLLPAPHAVRIALGGLSFAAGVGLQVREEYTAGAACVALATLLAAIRPPVATPDVRGPGRWLPVALDRALGPQRRLPAAWPNLRTRAGRVLAGLFCVMVAVGVVIARWLEVEDAWLVVLDSAPVIPSLLLGCGVVAKPADDPSVLPWLVRALQRLRRVGEIHTTLWGRTTGAHGAADELRLLSVPRAPLPGLVAIELGFAWSATPGGWLGAPEVLVRVRADSPASLALCRELPGVRTVPGRKTDERVARLVPRTPTRSCATALVTAIARRMTERRGAAGARTWAAPERRGAPEPWTSISAPLPASSPGAGVAA